MRGSSTPPGHSLPFCASLSGYSTGVARLVNRRPSLLSASPSRDVWPPIFSSPLSSSARYSTKTLPFRTTAAGLNVAYASHRTRLSLVGERNVAAGLGVRTGLLRDFTNG